MSHFRHLILTRFNMRIEQCEPQDLDWLEHRFDIRPVYFCSVFDLAMVQAVASEMARGFSHLITTRLDNDDAICGTFVDTVQRRFSGQDFQFLNFTNGYIWKEGLLYPARHFSNPFVSLVERAEKCSTVYCRNHVELDHVGPIEQVTDPAAWLQVVGGRNLSNDAWGITEEPRDLHEQFGIAPGNFTAAATAAPGGKIAPAA